MKLSEIKVLSKDELQRVNLYSLEILESVGIKTESKKVINLFKEAGAIVDVKEGVIKIPSHLVEEALKAAPHPEEITLFDRNGKPSIKFSETVGIVSGFNAVYVLEGKERRPAKREDVAKFAKLADALKNINVVGVQALPQDVLREACEVYAAEETLLNTRKHTFYSPTNGKVVKTIFKMAEAITGVPLSKVPILSCQVSPTSPLKWEIGAAEVLLEAAKANVLCNVLPEPITGITAPVTLAGTLALLNAEFLSGITISQLARKGTPVMYGPAPTILDMKTANPVIGTPEAVLLRIASIQLAKFHGLPSHIIALDSDSHCLDEQNSWEKLATILMALASGVNFIVNAGMFATGMTVSYEQLVVDDELAGYSLRLLRGIDVDDDKLAIDVIKNVGHMGHYLKEKHTLKYLQEEHWMPELSCRSRYGEWRKVGAKDVIERAKEKALKTLKEHKVEELDETIKENVRSVRKRFEKEVLKK